MQEIDNGRNMYMEEAGGGISIDIGKIIVNLVKKLWLMLLVGAVLAGYGFITAKSNYVPSYSSEMTLSFMVTEYVVVKDYSNRKDAEVQYQQETTFYGASDAQKYQTLLKSDEMVEKIKTKLDEMYPGNTYDHHLIASSLSVLEIPERISGFFVIKVDSADKGYCERVLDAVLETFPDYVKEFDSTISIKTIKSPSAPTITNADGATNKAITNFIFGAAGVAVVVALLSMMATTVTNVENLRRDVDARVLGSVPVIEKPKGLFGKKSKGPQGSLLITDSSKVSFTFVESFKSIRTKLENVKSEKGHKVFVVTSTYEDEGKTTVAVNIACSLAQKGKSVLLIDGDLRKPAVLHAVGVKSDTRYGLIPIIKGTSTYVDSIKFIKSLGIFVLPTGGISVKSTEVLDADKVRSVIEQARNEFDYIIIDSPPSKVVADSMVIAPLADGIIYCVRNDYAKVKEINRTIEEIKSADIEIIGTIFTMSNSEENNRYYKRKSYGYYGRRRKNKGGYGEYGNYGYGYGYGGYGYGYGNGYGYGYGYGYGQPENQNDKKIDNE